MQNKLEDIEILYKTWRRGFLHMYENEFEVILLLLFYINGAIKVNIFYEIFT